MEIRELGVRNSERGTWNGPNEKGGMKRQEVSHQPRFHSEFRILNSEFETPRNPNTELREVSRQFEAFFVLQLWRAMKATVPNQSETVNYMALFDLPFAEHLSQGGNFQIGSLIYEQMSRYIQQGEKHENH